MSVLTQRIPPGQLERELGKVEQRRDPPVPVWAWLHIDAREVAGELHGWATDPNGADDGWRGLVTAVREYAPGFHQEFIGWIPAEQIRPLAG